MLFDMQILQNQDPFYFLGDLGRVNKAMELFKKANVNVVHIPFDEAKIDFLMDEKYALTFEMLQKLRELGTSREELIPLEEKMHALFGQLVQA